MNKAKNQKISQLLLGNRGGENTVNWYWLKITKTASEKDANKFMLASILDWQTSTKVVWEAAKKMAEETFKDPEKLWHKITSVSLEDWKAKHKEYSLHRYPKAHERVWTIGKRIVEQYDGNCLKIWEGQPSDEILDRLLALKVGPNISRMIVGGLIDTGQITEKGDVKADTHVRRVLGRICRGKEYSPQEEDLVIQLTREMNSENPWLLDRPLYHLGKQYCKKSDPKCGSCYMQGNCEYSRIA